MGYFADFVTIANQDSYESGTAIGSGPRLKVYFRGGARYSPLPTTLNLKRCVFRSVLYCDCVFAVLTLSGSPFHRAAAATTKHAITVSDHSAKHSKCQ